jgi:hypothetical protein
MKDKKGKIFFQKTLKKAKKDKKDKKDLKKKVLSLDALGILQNVF